MKFYLPLLFGVGVGAWVFNKMAGRTHRAQLGVITGIIVGLMAFFVFFTLYSTVKK
jgi:hypothetical protein